MGNNSISQGVWTAIITPFDEKLEIDWNAYENLLIRQEKAGISGIVVCGTTGEAPTLTVQEKLALIKKARAILSDNIQIMGGTGSNNTTESIELSKLALDAGCDSLLIVTPPYNKPTLSGLIRHFGSIAKNVTAPICLYHVPGRTAQCLTPQEISELCNIKNITSVKEASGDVALFSRSKNASSADFFSGDDPTYLASLSVGSVGAISVASNVFPKAMVELTNAFFDGNIGKAQKIHNILLPMIDVLFCESNPSPVKAALEMSGFCKNTLRSPLAPVTDASYSKIKITLNNTQKLLEELN
jgi:4-hydroxy-tetrahydrodipicolinate synthase